MLSSLPAVYICNIYRSTVATLISLFLPSWTTRTYSTSCASMYGANQTKGERKWKQQHVRNAFIAPSVSSLCAGRPGMFLRGKKKHPWARHLWEVRDMPSAEHSGHCGYNGIQAPVWQTEVNMSALTWRWDRAARCATAEWAVCLCSGPGGWRWGWAARARTVRAWRGAWAPARSGLRRSGTWSWGTALPWSRPWTETPTQRWNWGIASSLTPPFGECGALLRSESARP